MSQFNVNDYNNLVNRAQNGAGNGVKVGYFKLANDGDEALVRINCSALEDLVFASIHTISAGGKWLKVSCLNEVGSYGDACPLCSAVTAGNKAISKAAKKVYIQMLVSYKDKTSGQWSAPAPVIWERPAGFYKEIANKLRDYGDLKQVLLKITRNGVAGDMHTTYGMDYAIPTVFKPEMIPADFSAFNNFNIAKHSYWEKTIDEIKTFLATGAFPEKENTNANYAAATPAAPAYQAPVNSTPYVAPAQPAYAAPVQPAYAAPATPVAESAQPANVMPPVIPTTPAPATPVTPAAPVTPATNTQATQAPRNFTGFAF